MNFERGKDPLKTLDLGTKQKLEKQLEAVANYIGCFHEDIPKVINHLLEKKADVEVLKYFGGDLAEMYWTNHKGQRRRSRIGYPDRRKSDQWVEVVKRKWYGKKYTVIERFALGPFKEMIADIKFSEENLSWEATETI
jgi:hypothetical protein